MKQEPQIEKMYYSAFRGTYNYANDTLEVKVFEDRVFWGISFGRWKIIFEGKCTIEEFRKQFNKITNQ